MNIFYECSQLGNNINMIKLSVKNLSNDNF